MKCLYYLFFLMICPLFSKGQEVQNYTIDSVYKITDKVWENCSYQWENKLLQLDKTERNIKITSSKTFAYNFKIQDKVENFIDPKNGDNVFVYKCLNDLSMACKVFFAYPPKNSNINFVKIFIDQPLVQFMYYCHAF